MTTLMDDLKGLYNELTSFSKQTVESQFPKPIKVQFSKEYQALFFEQAGNSLFSQVPVHYSLGLWEDLQQPTWLLPEDYDQLMSSLFSLIMDQRGYLLKDRTCVAPQNYGFDVYVQDETQPWKGPEIITSIRFISGKSWLWKKWIERKYKIKLIDNFKKTEEK